MISKTLALLMLIIFCPYITFGLFNSDLSPIYLVLILFIALSFGFRYKELLLFSFVFIFLSLYIALFSESGDFLPTLKLFVSIILSVVTFRLSSGNVLINRVKIYDLKVISFLWLLSGVITKNFPSISNFLLTRSLDDSNAIRGFQGLTSEPSIYSISSCFLILFTLIVYKNNTTFSRLRSLLSFPAILFVIAILFSKSVFGFAYLAVILFHFFIIDQTSFDLGKLTLYIKDLKLSLFATILSIVAILIYLSYNSSSRIYIFLTNLFSSPEILTNIGSDASFLFRFNSLLVIFNSFLPTKNLDLAANTTGGITLLFFNYGFLAFLILFIGIRFSPTLLYAASSINKSRLLLILFLPLLIFGPLYIPVFWLILPHYNLS